MTRQTSQPIETLRLTATNRLLYEMVRLHQDGTLDLRPPYQRGAVWTEDQQIALVRSFTMGVPVPSLIMNERRWAFAGSGRGIYAMIDGQQRVLAATEWLAGRLAVPASWFPHADVAETVSTDDGPYVRFTGLIEDAQRCWRNTTTIPVAEAHLGRSERDSIRMEAEVYLLVNGAGTPQTDQDLANAAQVAAGAEKGEG